MKKLSLIFYFSLMLAFLAASAVLNKKFSKPPLEISKQNSSINFNESALTLFSSGHKRFISSLLWIETLLESDTEHYKKRDQNSWMYLRFNSIINLDPHFYEAYLYGGQYLSIIKDDKWGAEDILEKGVVEFPDDFWLNYHLGFHSYFELGDSKRAIFAYEKILNHPLTKEKIPYLPSIIARLKSEEGKLENAFLTLKKAYDEAPEGILKRKYHISLYALKAQIDLECLNKTSQKNCEKKDFDGNKYLKNASGFFEAQKSWESLKIYERSKNQQLKKETL